MSFEEFAEFVEATPHPVLYTKYCTQKLLENEFQEVFLHSNDPLPQKGFIRCQRRAILAYNLKRKDQFICLASHDDNPTLQINDAKLFNQKIYNQYCTPASMYGGSTWISYIDRNLQLSGEIVHEDGSYTTIEPIKNFGIIPGIAIHMKPRMRFNPSFNAKENFYILHGSKTIQEIIGCDIQPNDKLDLAVNSAEQPQLINDLLASPRLDNIAMSYCAFSAFLESVKNSENEPNGATQIFLTFDKEEIGSHGLGSASDSFLNDCLKRIFTPSDLMKCKLNSLILSIDATHGDHPLFPNKAESNHRCYLGKGPVLTESCPGYLGTDEKGGTIITLAGRRCGVNVQTQVDLNSLSGGGTIGTIVGKATGVPTVDFGLCVLSMHSYREVMAYKDLIDTRTLFIELYNNYSKYAN